LGDPVSVFFLPALAKILLTFAVILVLSRYLPLWACLFSGAAIVGLWMGLDPFQVIDHVWTYSFSAQSLWLILILGLILVLSDLLGKSGQLERIVSSFQGISPSPKFTVVAMPALIGLLPMPGGAIFSAPMVETTLRDDRVAPELKVAINYWFRHVVEFWWPLYPGTILAISLFGVEAWKMAAAQSPLSLGSVLGGVLFILPLLPSLSGTSRKFSSSDLGSFLTEISPVLFVVIGIFVLQGLMEAIGYFFLIRIPWPQYLSFVIALCGAIISVVLRNSLSFDLMKGAVLNKQILSIAMIILGIMAFKGLLVESKLMEMVKGELATYRIPPVAIIAVLPFIAGMVTGIAVAFVGSSFPLVISLIPEGNSPLPFAVLAYGFGYMGMMLSPVHLCLLLTNEYFCADMMIEYRYLWRPALFGLAFTILIFTAYRFIL
jgi:integral membrane protein (TIGR00529 family)